MKRILLAATIAAMPAIAVAQVRGSAPKVVNATDAMGLVNSTMAWVQSALPIVIQLAYFLVVIAILLRMFRQRAQGLQMIELIGLGIMFGLMKG